MSQIQITDINLDDSQLYNGSEACLNDLKDNETDQIVGGFSFSSNEEYLNKTSISMKLEVSGEAHVVTNVHILKEPICYYPVKPICWYPKPIHDQKPFYPIKPIHFCPVIL